MVGFMAYTPEVLQTRPSKMDAWKTTILSFRGKKAYFQGKLALKLQGVYFRRVCFGDSGRA